MSNQFSGILYSTYTAVFTTALQYAVIHFKMVAFAVPELEVVPEDAGKSFVNESCKNNNQ